MNEIVALNKQSIPAHLRKSSEKRDRLKAALTEGASGGVSYPRISIRAARFRLVRGSEETVLDSSVLSAIIIGVNPRNSKSYYTEAWTPDAESAAPPCFSLDGIRPHPDAQDPQHDLCATCEKNAFGSATNAMGNPIKACSDRRRLALVSADDPDGEVFLLQVTPAALSSFRAYQKELAGLDLGPMDVITHVYFDPKASYPKLMFRFGGYLDEDTSDKILDRCETDLVLEITGQKLPGSIEAQPATPVEETPKKPLLVKPAEPEPEEVEEAEEVAPTPVAAAPKKAPAKKAAPKKDPEVKSTSDDMEDLIGDLLEGLEIDDE